VKTVSAGNRNASAPGSDSSLRAHAPALRSQAHTLFRAEAGTLRRAYVAAGLSGVLIAACFLRFGLFPLAWIAFAPVIWAIGQVQTGRDAARIGLVAGLVTNVPAFYWLVYTIHVFGGFGYALAAVFYLGLSVYAAQQFVLFALALRRTGFGPLALAPPVLWVALEFLFPNLFPWRMANCQWHVPVLMQIGDLTGPFGLSFIMVWVAAATATLISRGSLRPLLVAVAVLLGVIAYGAVRLSAVDAAQRAAPAVRVALVQGNVSIKEKGDIKYFDVNIEKYQQLSEDVQHMAEVIVWPETVAQRWVEADTVRLQPKDNPFDDLQTHLIFGGLAFRLRGSDPRDAEEFNSAFLVAPEGAVLGRYDKHILMPFGEYIPLGSWVPWIYSLSPESGHFTAGTGVSLFRIPDGATIGPLICYEDLLAGMSRQATAAGAEVLLNILNDAWYGDTAAPYQHQALALWRAIENRRYLLRGSNSGVTSIIDAAGRVVAEGGLFRPEVVSGAVPRLHIETFYTHYGDVFGWSVVLAAGLLVWRALRRGEPYPSLLSNQRA